MKTFKELKKLSWFGVFDDGETAWEFSLFEKFQSFSDGLQVVYCDFNILTNPKIDHTPSINCLLVIMNYRIFELNLYSTEHSKENSDDDFLLAD